MLLLESANKQMKHREMPNQVWHDEKNQEWPGGGFFHPLARVRNDKDLPGR